MSKVLISPYSAVEATVRRHRPSHVVTLMADPVPTPEGIAPDRHLRVAIHDIVEPMDGSVHPDSGHIAGLLNFGRSWDRSAPFLVHCWAGISRSTAAAYILLCDLHGPGHEDLIARGLRANAPHAHPNRLMIRHADQLLQREGRMMAAIAAMSPAWSAWEADVVQLPLSLEELG